MFYIPACWLVVIIKIIIGVPRRCGIHMHVGIIWKPSFAFACGREHIGRGDFMEKNKNKLRVDYNNNLLRTVCCAWRVFAFFFLRIPRGHNRLGGGASCGRGIRYRTKDFADKFFRTICRRRWNVTISACFSFITLRRPGKICAPAAAESSVHGR